MPHEIRQYVAEQLRGVNRETRTLSIVASDFSLDSYGTRIDPAGWDLEQFKKNGPICVQHDTYSRGGLPVAQAVPETVRIEGGKLVMDIRFAPAGADETADRVFELAAAGILRGVSVGFDPSEYEDTTERMPDGKEFSVRVYKKQRLMEVSIVTIPSNDNGLIQRAVKLGADETMIRKMTEQLENTLKTRQVPENIESVMALVPDCEIKKEMDKRWKYFELKQPANRESTKVLARFYEKILKSAPPEKEEDAWKRMGEAVEAIQEKPDEEAKKTEQFEEPKAAGEKAEEPAKPNPIEQEAPAPERKASVQIPLSVLMEFPAKLTKSYMDSAAEALRQGVPLKDAIGLIGGMNAAVCNSISQVSNASNS